MLLLAKNIPKGKPALSLCCLTLCIELILVYTEGVGYRDNPGYFRSPDGIGLHNGVKSGAQWKVAVKQNLLRALKRNVQRDTVMGIKIARNFRKSTD